ncbi:MAG: GWxTD domain-containing protein, partial [Candidatus Delongbacteria bacterium]|nr:GWxTD domain-containing protein [Candidatus Delongbacteria bacterium]
ELPPGYYKLVVEVEDINLGKKVDTLEVPQDSKMFMIAKFEDKFSVSTIQLASKIITDKADEKSEFFKQGVIILPNPSKIFGTNRPFVYYYAEIYGLNPNDDLEYCWTILSNDGEEIRKGNVEKKKSTGKSMVIADRVSIPSFKTGAYNLILSIANKTGGKMIEGKNNFYIYRKIDFSGGKFKLPEEMKDITISGKDSIEFDIMKDDEIIAEYDQILSTLEKKEQNKYTGLLLTGKREFLKKYWTERETKQENARENFKLLLQKINNEFSTKKNEGWKTDRGRIFLKMGQPDKRDIETYNNEYADHEIWQYFSGNYTFVFADTHGLGDFKLIHSDYPGEKSNLNWETKIKKSKF